jgi:hypothetical protein
MTGLRAALASRRIRIVVLIGVAVVASAFVLSRLPKPVEGIVTLDECALMPAPVIVADAAIWRGALPGDTPGDGPKQIPIASWPEGMRYDMATSTLLDADGTVRFRRGDEVRIRGEVFEARGDPSPCYFIYSVRITHIEPATP